MNRLRRTLRAVAVDADLLRRRRELQAAGLWRYESEAMKQPVTTV